MFCFLCGIKKINVYQFIEETGCINKETFIISFYMSLPFYPWLVGYIVSERGCMNKETFAILIYLILPIYPWFYCFGEGLRYPMMFQSQCNNSTGVL